MLKKYIEDSGTSSLSNSAGKSFCKVLVGEDAKIPQNETEEKKKCIVKFDLSNDVSIEWLCPSIVARWKIAANTSWIQKKAILMGLEFKLENVGSILSTIIPNYRDED